MKNVSAIVANNLVKTYPGTESPAVNRLSLNIARGSFFGLLGPNGAGKTSLISMLCGLTRPTSGTIAINELNPRIHAGEVKKIIGFVPQDIALYPTLTAKENLAFFGNMHGLSGRALEERIEEGLTTFGLSKHAHKLIKTFSGGMKRRVNLLAATLHRPQILFLDEPTVGIDVQSRTAITAHLQELNRQGTTMVYTSHHMDEARQLCSEVAILDQGNIMAQANPRMLLEQENCDTLDTVFLKLTGHQLRD